MTETLIDNSELLFRQVHPSFIQDGQISSQPFCPTPKDDNKLSVDRGSKTTPQVSHSLFTANGGQSAAVYGLSVDEFLQERLPCHPDPIEAFEGKKANPAHAVADYSAHGPNQQKNKAKRLKHKAVARGPLHITCL
jgi:hypothetical protein